MFLLIYFVLFVCFLNLCVGLGYFPEMARQKHFLDGKYQDKRTRRYEPPKHNEKSSPLAVETMTTPKEPAWVEHE